MVVPKLFSNACPWKLDTLLRQIAAALVSLAITFVLAGISDRYTEVPAMNRLKRRSSFAPLPQPTAANLPSPLAKAEP